MIVVLVLLHFCNFLPVSTLYLGNRFPAAYEFLGEKNISNINADGSEAGLHAEFVQEAVVRSTAPALIIRTLPVGSGDATIIECPPPPSMSEEHHHWFSLIDMGSSPFDPAGPKMTRHNYEQHIELLIGGEGYRLKHIFLTHPDIDHYNYAFAIEGQKEVGLLPMLIDKHPSHLKDITIHISSVDYWWGLPDKSQTLENFLAYLEKIDNLFTWETYDPDGENVIDICGTSNEGRTPPSYISMKIIAADLGRKSNEMSMVMSLSYQQEVDYNGGRMLFLGDLEGGTQYLLLLRNEKYRQYLPADVVMVPHHGSDEKGNGNPLFYDFVNAKHAIISSHIKHKNGHPQLTTLAAICNGFYLKDEEPYYPYSLCNAMERCPSIDMAQGHGNTHNFNNPVYNDGNQKGCRTKIHQTTKKTENVAEPLKTFIVTTNLYPDQDPEVVSQEWHA